MLGAGVDSLLNPKFIYFILGVIFLSVAVVSTCAGKTISRSTGWIYRAKNPTDFWWTVAIGFLAAVVCIGIYLRSLFPEAVFHPELWLHLK